MVKKKLTLSINEEIITQAKKQQINLSSFLEIRLVDYLSYKECSRRGSNTSSWLERPEWWFKSLFLRRLQNKVFCVEWINKKNYFNIFDGFLGDFYKIATLLRGGTAIKNLLGICSNTQAIGLVFAKRGKSQWQIKTLVWMKD